MKKLCGRKLNPKFSGIIMNLDSEKMYTVADVASRAYSKTFSKVQYEKALDSLRKLAKRNDLQVPDNAMRDGEGRVILNEEGKSKGRPKLKEGERFPKYFGWRWKGILYDCDQKAGKKISIDRPAVEKQVEEIRDFLRLKLQSGQNRTTVLMKRAKRVSTWGFGTAFAAFLLTATVTIARFGYQEIIDVYLTQGIRAALEMALSSKDAGLDQYFALGWLYYQDRKHDKARNAMTHLQKHKLSKRLTAKVHYTLGLLDIQIEKFDGAYHHLIKAEQNYVSLDDSRGIQKVRVEFARIHRLRGAPEKALNLLTSIEETWGLSPQIIRLYMVTLADHKDYKGSLPYADLLLKEEIPMYRVLGLQHKAYCSTIFGDYSAALEYLVKADVLIEDIGGDLFKRMNQLGFYHLMNCREMDISDIRESLETWAIENQNIFFIKEMHDPTRLPCSE